MKKFTQTIIAIALAAAGAQAFAATNTVITGELRDKDSGSIMSAPVKKLSEQAEMELAGYERVGSFKTACISSSLPIGIQRTDGHKNIKAWKLEECTIYKERDKDLPNASIN